ncbi:MAG TPA: ketol-acid reductoisomerase [Candidatus Eisenbacteria bacterium]|nr:ketol-acid reductoisomerase [Candidatus Eisenbacteria bacterium]
MSDRLSGRTVAVLGFGNQGEAQALNLRDSGVTVVVGARAGGAGETRARAHGFETLPLDEAARRAAVCAVLLPDERTPELWPAIAAALPPGAGVVFAHGFALLYSDLSFPPQSDVVLVSPTGPGRVLREVYVRGAGLPAYLAVHRDGSGEAWGLAESYAGGIGSARARLWRTTVREETEVDLFGEQAVLCGGMNALVTAAFETLVERGYSPEIAYLECVHQLKYLADLLHERGVAGMRRGISGTALYGDVTRGPRVVGEPARAAMAALLDEIRSGAFAREWAGEIARGAPRLAAEVARAAAHPIEQARAEALGGPQEPGKAGGEPRNALSKN